VNPQIFFNPQAFGIFFLLGTAAIALWFDARFPALAPADLRRAMLRAGIAMAAGWVLFPPMWDAVSKGSVLVALFAIAFPCLTYTLLSAVWAIKKLQAAMQGFR
jgi:hypothetical protein